MSYGNGGEQWGGPVQQAGTLGQAMKSTEPIEARPQVGRELEHHQKATEALHQVIEQLIQRLEPILAPMPPRVENGTEGQQRSASQVVSVLRAQGYRIDAATQRLGEVINRIEL